jgi:hypothetical protein
MPLFIKFVLMCFFLLTAAYLISSTGSPFRKLISKHWRVISLSQLPNPFNQLEEEESIQAKIVFEQKIKTSYINFMKQGNYESKLLSDQSSYGVWSVNKESTQLTLEYNGSKEVLFIKELTESKMILHRKRVGEEMTVVLVPA